MDAFFLDTYAMIEYLRGNSRYLKYFTDTELATSIMNLIELFFLVLREDTEEKADSAYNGFHQYLSQILDQDVKSGMKLRLKARLNKIDLSYADAIGYVMAERLGARYLTGDSAFKALPNVEFLR